MSVLWRPIDSWGNFTLTLTAVDAVKRHQSDICQEFSQQYWTKRGHGKVRGLSTPKSDSLPKLFRNAILNRLMRLTLMSPRAQVTENNEFILESVRSIKDVVQMHVPKLVDLFFPVFRPKECHLGDQNLGFQDIRMSVKPWR